MNLLLLGLAVLSLWFSLTPISVSALKDTGSISDQTRAFAGKGGANIIGKGPAEDPRFVIAKFISYALGFLGILFMVAVIYAGFTIMTSGGAQDKMDTGYKTLRRSALGVLIVLSAYSLTTFIVNKIGGARQKQLIEIRMDGQESFRPPAWWRNLGS